MSRIILPIDLQGRSLSELWSLHAEADRALTRSAAGSAERRDALASLENIRRAIAAHKALLMKPTPSP